MSFNFVMNSSNVVPGTNNSQYRFNFPNNGFQFPEGSEMSISQVTIPYSWFNITSALGNNQFQYTLTQGTPGSLTTITKTVTLLDGFYTQTDINAALQANLKSNGFYWYTEGQSSSYLFGSVNQTIVYPISFSAFPNQYANQFTFQYIPPTDSAGVAVASSSITNGLLTFGSAQTLIAGVEYYLSGLGVSAGTFITGSGSSTAIYNVNIPQVVVSTAITFTRRLVWDQLGYNFTWAGGDGTNAGQVTGGSIAYSPTITILGSVTPTSYQFGNIVGFSSGTFPATAQSYTAPATNSNSSAFSIYGNSLRSYTYPVGGTIQSQAITFSPLGSKVNGIICLCNIVDNGVSVPGTVLDSFPITSTFGSNISYLPIAENWITMRPGRFSNLTITFVDQSFNQIVIQDPNVLITLLIRLPLPK